QPQLRGPPRQGRQDPSGEPTGRGSHGDRRPLHPSGGPLIVEPVTRIEGTALPLDRADVDTDQIIPAEYLKRVERTGFGPFLFDGWRKDPAFIFNDERFAGASILIA